MNWRHLLNLEDPLNLTDKFCLTSATFAVFGGILITVGFVHARFLSTRSFFLGSELLLFSSGAFCFGLAVISAFIMVIVGLRE